MELTTLRSSFLLIGCIGNLLSIIILTQKTLLKRQKFNWYLLFQTIADLISLLILWPGSSLYRISLITCLFTDIFYETADVLSVVLVLVVRIDRLYATIKPFNNINDSSSNNSKKPLFTSRYPKIITAVCLFIVVLVNLPKLIWRSRSYDYE